MPDELWTEVHDIVQKTGIKTIPVEKKCKKAKWLSEEALKIAEKRREAKGKGKKERYIHLNAEFQRIARRDKKAFLNEQCKEIEENNRMVKTRDLFKTFANKGLSSQSYGSPVVMYGCESWTIKKAECRRINAFKLGVGEDS